MAVAVLRDTIKETMYIIRNIIFAHNTFNAGKETQQTFLKSFKLFPESLYFRKIQNSAIVLVTFLHNRLTVQLPTSASDCKFAGNIPGSHFVKSFSALPSHS